MLAAARGPQEIPESDEAVYFAELAVRRAEREYEELARRCRAREAGVDIDVLVKAASRLALARGDLARERRKKIVDSYAAGAKWTRSR